MKADPVQIVVGGCGAVSQFQYVPALQALEQIGAVKVTGLVDPGVQQRAELQKSFSHASPHTELTACPLNSNTLVIVASPPRFHAEQSIFALQQGAAVLCEKPMASSSAEAELMLKAACDSKSPLAVGLHRRFLPAAEMINHIFDKKPLGKFQGFTIQEGQKFGWGAASDSYFKRDLTPGGVFYDIGVHVTDLLLWWLGEPATFTYQDDAMGGIEANCQLELVYPGGERGTVRLSRDWETQNRHTFSFEKGTVVYEVGQATQLKISLDGTPSVLSGELMRISSKNGMVNGFTKQNPYSFVEQLRNVIAAMKSRQPLKVPGEEGIRSLRFIEDCYAKRTLMDMPWLSAEESKAARVLSGGNL